MKRTIAIVAGGDSSEHGVSMKSAEGIYSFIDKEKYNLYIVELTKKSWEALLPDGTRAAIDKNDFSFTENGKKVKPDFAYITIHGTPGENGILQGYFELLDIPYSTCDVLVSALTFSKFTLNQYLKGFGIRVAESMLVNKRHGISDEDVKECPTFAQIAKSLEQFISGCDFGGFNSNRFDLPVLVEEFLRAGINVDFKRRRFVDVQNIFHKMEQRTLSAAYKFYCDKDLANAHSAEADTMATYEVLQAQLDRYDTLQNDIDFLAEFSTRNEAADYAGRILYNDKGEEVFGFGKYKGRSVAEIFEIEPSYYNWMMNGDFPLYTKKVITEIRLRGKETKKREG